MYEHGTDLKIGDNVVALQSTMCIETGAWVLSKVEGEVESILTSHTPGGAVSQWVRLGGGSALPVPLVGRTEEEAIEKFEQMALMEGLIFQEYLTERGRKDT